MRMPKRMSSVIRVLPGSLTLSVGLSALVGRVNAQSGLSLWVDSTTYLAPNTPNQIVRVYLQNSSGGPFPVIGGTFYFQIDDGDPTSAAPSITGVNIADISGNPFITIGSSANVDPTVTQTNAEYWDVVFTTLPDPPVTPVNLTASTYTFAEVTVDTTGFNVIGDSWDFKITNTVGTPPGTPSFDVLDPSDPTNILTENPVATNGQIQIGVAPIPEASTSRAGLCVVGMSMLWFYRKRAATRRSGSN